MWNSIKDLLDEENDYDDTQEIMKQFDINYDDDDLDDDFDDDLDDIDF